MADKKISALTAATTPLAGTEVLPIVQSGSTVKVSVANLTAGRTVSSKLQQVTDRLEFPSTQTTYGANSISNTGTTIQIQGGTGGVNIRNNADTYNLWAIDDATGDVTQNVGNIKFNTSGKGIDFSATPGTGTSELLADYEEGTWTPDLRGNDVDPTSVTYDGGVFGRYTKIGNIVHIEGYMRTDAVTKGGMATYVQIGGLPYAAAVAGTIAVSEAENWTINNPCSLVVLAGQSIMQLYFRTTANGVTDRLPVSAVSTTADQNIVRFGGSYFV